MDQLSLQKLTVEKIPKLRKKITMDSLSLQKLTVEKIPKLRKKKLQMNNKVKHKYETENGILENI